LAFLLAWVMVIVGALAFGPGGISWAQSPRTLQGVPVPEPPDLASYVKDKAAAIRLGKALFWDMQVGSDGVQACASCHFQAGGDIRVKNQLDPGLAFRGHHLSAGRPEFHPGARALSYYDE
jgi:cytochrome c peroxidase